MRVFLQKGRTPSTRSIRRPRSAGDVATLVGHLLVQESDLAHFIFLIKGSGNAGEAVCQHTLSDFLFVEGLDRQSNASSIRTGCKAMIRLLRTTDHAWYISRVCDTHNHSLSDSFVEKKAVEVT